jgi:peptidyl-prolyl cis-trans isomerase D
MIDGIIAGAPAFQNVAGKFDETLFRTTLQTQRITEQQLRDQIRQQLIQRQLLGPVEAWPKVPTGVAREYAALLLEARSGSVGVVPVEAVGPGAAPTDAEIAAYFRANQARYTIPERRILRYAMFGRPDIAAEAKASEAEITAAYKENSAAYGARETRTFAQITLPDQAAAQAFAAKVKAGTSFAQAAAAAGFSASDIASWGEQTKEGLGRIASTAVADAAFAAARGEVIGPVRSPLGWHVARVETVTTTAARPLESVRGEIVARIEERKAQDALADLAARIEDSIADGATFDELVQAHRLQSQETPLITAAGTAPETPGFQLAADLKGLLQPGFDMAEEEDPIVQVLVPGQRYAILRPTRIVAAAPPPLVQVVDRVRADLVRERSFNRARTLAKQLSDKINAGTPIRDAFAQAGVALPPVQTVNARRMDIAQPGAQVPQPVRLMFNIPRGRSRIIAAPENAGWFVVHLAQVTPGDIANAPGLTEATASQFRQAVGSEYAEQFVRAVEREIDVERNAAAIKTLKDQMLRNRAVE